ncbi:MAG: secondary thiamine-phosphate synthase enzyme YjbQ [Deltaproteobacteria bacterium]|nr:secondary thiamine-phosphate synthase enzyme YjbQ [Deltaproteobacteria bacterium]
MKVFSSNIRLNSTKKTEEIKISEQIESVVLESGIEEGMVLVSTGHTTAGIHLNNADKELEQDLQDYLSELIPNKPTFRHNKGDYGRNADAHLKSVFVGSGVNLPITRGKLSLGQWQAVYFSEFDGPRSRLISVKIIGKSK